MSDATRRALLSAAVMVPTSAAVIAMTSGTAHAAYSWDRKLKKGMKGNDVKQLQIRVAGYPGYGNILSLDGEFGARTESAVKRFQKAYGLAADGVAGSRTFRKIYSLQDGDNTPKHFSYAELNGCNSSWAGGTVSSTTAKYRALITMWKLEAMRHALGDKSISVSSGFRSKACNDAVGGASNSQHMTGSAADLVGSHSLCTLAKQARYHGFGTILGPGYDGHGDHVHLDGLNRIYWSAPNCGV
ncbi:D-Ala-D-Ala carboxypeptidase family metallohydrolase [Stackebrandtia nassauensis]|uniref:Zinc D-Ala-D-Ala carboxypeptidase n=1 Tax=Stackebrandtia nassauensis (strain DSM 44728 / CIP 108903 / NRRL B-16338 / NBRC 102104 / LLR-40K-21) TaxID=446470 RepID=D3PV96_STANL|nr:D-Ala-D-Ala carboxypeptidase family metallohydrolase [Stackebrandtia nassauensis]ADD41149.1 Zinc D-Ala-D-Ala carboxypeptidase [Stackebrandtia nassauensis DSM 44728]